MSVRWFEVICSSRFEGTFKVEASCRETIGMDKKWYCIISNYGCSKDYISPRDAIIEMLLDHAVTVSKITEIDRAGNKLP